MILLGPAICHDCHARLYLRATRDNWANGRKVYRWAERRWTGYSHVWRQHRCTAIGAASEVLRAVVE